MAKIRIGILGGFSGKIGNVVGRKVLGKNCMQVAPDRSNLELPQSMKNWGANMKNFPFFYSMLPTIARDLIFDSSVAYGDRLNLIKGWSKKAVISESGLFTGELTACEQGFSEYEGFSLGFAPVNQTIQKRITADYVNKQEKGDYYRITWVTNFNGTIQIVENGVAKLTSQTAGFTAPATPVGRPVFAGSLYKHLATGKFLRMRSYWGLNRTSQNLYFGKY